MRVTRFACASLVASGLCLSPSGALAQDTPQALRQEIDQLRKDFDTLKQQYGDRLSALEAKLAAAEGTPAAPAAAQPAPGQPLTVPVPVGAQGAGGPTGALPVYGAAGASVASSKIFNPDMAVIGDFLGAAGRNTVNPTPALEMHESEAAFQAVVDPYARADFFVSFGEQGVNLEEGFMTFTELPGGLLTRVGKMRAAFGKVNTLHNHVLPWTDRPLVIQSLVGGEDGIDDAGFSVARLIPNPWIFLEATGQVFRGDSGERLFKSSERGDVSYVGHLRGYQDLSESTNIDLGLSYSDLYGVDATVRWKPLQRAIYHSFIGRTEWIWSHRDQFDGRQKAMGFYVSGDYQLGRRWFAGARYDRSDHADDASLLDSGQSLLLTYWPSEFSQVRGQYRRTKYAIGPTANELLFQFQFSIGAHGAHPF